MRVALFPGQGALRPGMGIPWQGHASGRLFDQIGEISGVDVRHLVEAVEGEELIRTDNAQLATFALSAVAADAADPRDIDVAVGHSLGEYSALYFAGILDLASATALVVERGRAMAEASRANPGTMAAILGADETLVSQALDLFTTLVIANQNASGQIVVAGSFDEITELKERSKDLGLRKVMALDVGGAFHSPLMESAKEPLRQALESTVFQIGHCPVIANVDATSYSGGPHWRSLLLEQLTGTVQFQSSIESLDSSSIEFFELGPGSVLAGLVKRITPDSSSASLGSPEDIARYEGAS